jgi:hypothetical protein
MKGRKEGRADLPIHHRLVQLGFQIVLDDVVKVTW